MTPPLKRSGLLQAREQSERAVFVRDLRSRFANQEKLCRPSRSGTLHQRRSDSRSRINEPECVSSRPLAQSVDRQPTSTCAAFAQGPLVAPGHEQLAVGYRWAAGDRLIVWCLVDPKPLAADGVECLDRAGGRAEEYDAIGVRDAGVGHAAQIGAPGR